MNLLKKNSKIFIRGVDTVGTFVLATPFYRELRKNFADSFIAICVKPLVYELVKYCPYVDEVIVYSRRNIFEEFGFIKKLNQKKFNTAFVLSGSFHSALMCYLAGIETRIGYPHDHRGFLLTHTIEEFEKQHCVEYLLHILSSIGCKIDNTDLELWLPENCFGIDKVIYDKYRISGSDIIVGIGFGVIGEKARQWTTQNWIELIRLLLNNKNLKVILFGTKNDIPQSVEIGKNINNKNLINLTGKTSLTEFCSFVSRCNLYVSLSTGGIHIASAAGTKVLGLYCPGDEVGWYPRGKNIAEVITKQTPCAPCNQHKMRYCKENICMKSISIDEVYSKVNTLLQK